MALVQANPTGRVLAKLKSALLIGLGTLLLACQPSSPLEDYPARLARVLQVSEPAMAPSTELPPLSKRETAQAMQAIQLSVVDWWQLKECNLNSLLAERNSSLGRVQAPSIRLSYEVDMLVALESCREQLPEHKLLLMQLIEQKQLQLERLWQHLWVSEASFARLFTPKQGELEGLAELEQWLSYLVKLQRLFIDQNYNQLQVELGRFQAEQKSAQAIPALPTLWFQQGLAQQQVRQANRTLAQEPRIQCVQGNPSAQAQLAKQFFQGYYLIKVQPELARSQADLQRLMPMLDELSSHWPPSLKARYKALLSQASPQELKQETKQHALLWQRFLKRCGLAPK